MNNKKILSICIPTFCRCKLLKYQLENIYAQLEETDRDLVEVLVSVNPAGDGTEEYLTKFAEGKDIVLNFNKVNVGGLKNIYKAIDKASGKYIWIVSDDDKLLQGLIKKVVTVLKEMPDISWLHINTARLDNNPSVQGARIIDPKYYWGKGGYFQNGKKTLLEKFKRMDGAVLFSTANILLRSSAVKIKKKYTHENMCTLLTFIFESSLHGGAYIMEEIMILAGGGEISWSDKVYEVNVRQFNEALMELTNWGYSEKEIKRLIEYRMTHEGLFIWFKIFMKFLKNPSKALEDLEFYYKYIPLTTILCIIFSPILAAVLIIRHNSRMLKRYRYIKKMKNDTGIHQEVRDYL